MHWRNFSERLYANRSGACAHNYITHISSSFGFGFRAKLRYLRWFGPCRKGKRQPVGGMKRMEGLLRGRRLSLCCRTDSAFRLPRGLENGRWCPSTLCLLRRERKPWEGAASGSPIYSIIIEKWASACASASAAGPYVQPILTL